MPVGEGAALIQRANNNAPLEAGMPILIPNASAARAIPRVGRVSNRPLRRGRQYVPREERRRS